jgi:hypothetical protein
MRHLGLSNGNVLVDEAHGTRMVIRSVDYSTGVVICTLESNWYDNGTDPAGLFDTDWDWTANTWSLYRTDIFTPKSRIFGDFTSGSNVITNVRTVGLSNETDYGLEAGAWFAAGCGAPGVYAVSTNDDTEITSIDTSRPTLTGVTTSAASPVVCTSTAHGLVTGQLVDASGFTEMTNLSGNQYRAAVLTANTFALYDPETWQPVDGSSGAGGWTAETTGGSIRPTYGTITLTDNARASAANEPLDFWYRKAPANEASV